MWIDIADWAILGSAVLFILSGIVWIRRRVAAGAAVTHVVLSSNAMYVIATVTVVVFDLSPLHLLWLFPVAFVVGLMSLLPPFSWAIVPLGKIYGTVCCVGVTPMAGPGSPDQ